MKKVPATTARAKLRPKKLYIALDDLNIDFTWFPHEVDQAVMHWNIGMSLAEMAKHFRRTEEEVFLLLMDLSMRGKIQEREGACFGKDHYSRQADHQEE